MSWKPIRGYETLYEISNTGKIRDFTTLRIIKYSYYKSNFHDLFNKYLSISLIDRNGKSKVFLAHELVAVAFVHNPSAMNTIVLHKNGNIYDNNACNLFWCMQCDYPELIVKIQKNESYCIRKYLKNGKLFDTFNSFTAAAESTKTTVPLTKTQIRRACKAFNSKAGVWYWEQIYHSRLPVPPNLSLNIIRNPSIAVPIPGYLHSPVITKYGHIYNSITGKPFPVFFTATRYLMVALIDFNSRTVFMFVHHLVISAFKGASIDSTKTTVDHIDGNKGNPCIYNLEYVTPHENTQRWREMYYKYDMLISFRGRSSITPANPSAPVGTEIFIETPPLF